MSCHKKASRCGQIAENCAARAIIAKGDVQGRIIASKPSGPSGRVTDADAIPKTTKCPIVSGIDTV